MHIIGVLLGFAGALLGIAVGLIGALLGLVVGLLVPLSPILLLIVAIVWLVGKPNVSAGMPPSTR
jgi:hypothetical protein